MLLVIAVCFVWFTLNWYHTSLCACRVLHFFSVMGICNLHVLLYLFNLLTSSVWSNLFIQLYLLSHLVYLYECIIFFHVDNIVVLATVICKLPLLFCCLFNFLFVCYRLLCLLRFSRGSKFGCLIWFASIGVKGYFVSLDVH